MKRRICVLGVLIVILLPFITACGGGDNRVRNAEQKRIELLNEALGAKINSQERILNTLSDKDGEVSLIREFIRAAKEYQDDANSALKTWKSTTKKSGLAELKKYATNLSRLLIKYKQLQDNHITPYLTYVLQGYSDKSDSAILKQLAEKDREEESMGLLKKVLLNVQEVGNSQDSFLIAAQEALDAVNAEDVDRAMTSLTSEGVKNFYEATIVCVDAFLDYINFRCEILKTAYE